MPPKNCFKKPYPSSKEEISHGVGRNPISIPQEAILAPWPGLLARKSVAR